jgi:hypothetical protein
LLEHSKKRGLFGTTPKFVYQIGEKIDKGLSAKSSRDVIMLVHLTLVIELSTYTTLRDKQVVSEGVYAILILNALATSSVASYTRRFYDPNAKST